MVFIAFLGERVRNLSFKHDYVILERISVFISKLGLCFLNHWAAYCLQHNVSHRESFQYTKVNVVIVVIFYTHFSDTGSFFYKFIFLSRVRFCVFLNTDKLGNWILWWAQCTNWAPSKVQSLSKSQNICVFSVFSL